jgi:hypothetical protein
MVGILWAATLPHARRPVLGHWGDQVIAAGGSEMAAVVIQRVLRPWHCRAAIVDCQRQPMGSAGSSSVREAGADSSVQCGHSGETAGEGAGWISGAGPQQQHCAARSAALQPHVCGAQGDESTCDPFDRGSGKPKTAAK